MGYLLFFKVYLSLDGFLQRSCQVLLPVLANSALFPNFCKKNHEKGSHQLCLAHRKGSRRQYRMRMPVTHTAASFQLPWCRLALVLLRRFQDSSSSEENRRVTSSSATASQPFLEKYMTSARLKHPWHWPATSSSMGVSSLWMIPARGNEPSFHMVK